MEFLIFGTFWFWSLAITAWILITIAAELGYYLRAAFVLIAFLALYFFFGGSYPSHIIAKVIQNPAYVVLAVLGYLIAGTIWGVIKWFFYILKERDIALENIKCNHRKTHFSPPQASEHKERIITWMLYWPFSMFWTIINDPLRRAFEWIYRRIGKFMQGVSDRIFKDVFDASEEDRNERAQQKRRERVGSL